MNFLEGRRSELVKFKKNGDVKDGIGTRVKRPKRMAIVTALVIIAVVVLNVIVSVIADRNLWYLDLTEVRYKSGEATMYTLSDSCRSLIASDAIPMIEKVNEEREKRGEEPITLNIIFCADKDYIEGDSLMRYVNMTARQLESEFRDCIEVQYVNIDKNPSAVQKFKTTSASTIYNSDVIVEFGSEYLIQKISSFFYTDEGKTSPWAYNGEQRLAAMILSLTRAEFPVCAITTNHGETLLGEDGKVRSQYSTFIKLIKGAGYDVEFIDLEKDEIPENCRMMICFDPQVDFKAFGALGESGVSEIEKLDKYLDDSNAFFYICNRETPYLKNIEEYLTEWGITVARVGSEDEGFDNYVIRDSVNCTDTGRGDVVIGSYGDVGLAEGITGDLQDQSYPPRVLFPGSTALIPSDSYFKTFVAADPENNVEECVYYTYYRNGVSRNMVEVFSTYNTATAYVGGEVHEIATDLNLFRLMTITRESRPVQETNYTTIDQSSYVLALSSVDFLSNEILDSSAYGNTDVILSALRQAGSEAVPANLRMKAFYIYTIEHPDGDEAMQSEAYVWLICLSVIPAIISAAVCVVVVIRRRTR